MPILRQTPLLGLGLDVEKQSKGTYQLLEHSIPLSEATTTVPAINVDIVPAHRLVAVEIELVDKPNREYMLFQALEDVRSQYDFVIIDCAPSLGLLTLNALTHQTLF